MERKAVAFSTFGRVCLFVNFTPADFSLSRVTKLLPDEATAVSMFLEPINTWWTADDRLDADLTKFLPRLYKEIMLIHIFFRFYLGTIQNEHNMF